MYALGITMSTERCQEELLAKMPFLCEAVTLQERKREGRS